MATRTKGAEVAAPQWDAARCAGCGLCALACPCGGIQMGADGPTFHCHEACRQADECVARQYGFLPCEVTCPRGAIAMPFAIATAGRET